MIRQKTGFILMVLFSIFMPSISEGKIPEPNNIIYGLAREDATVVVLKKNNEVLVSYTLGANPNAGGYYILRVPMDFKDPREPGTARPGDNVEIFINDESVSAASLVIGPRGGITKLDLAKEDSDNDGVTDDKDLCPATPATEQTDDKGCSDSQLDSDNDWVMNDKDICPGTPSGHQVDVDGCSASQRDTDGDGIMDDHDICPGTPAGSNVYTNGCIFLKGDINRDKKIDLKDSELGLKTITYYKNSADSLADVDGDGKIGLKDIIYIIQKNQENEEK